MTIVPSVAVNAEQGNRSSSAATPFAEITAASGPVHDIPVGGALPSDATCAARVIPTAENRPANVSFNNTRGVGANNENARVNGNFVGTTDEILQWAACKWGIDVQWARNQAALESFWRQNDTFGDFGSDPSMCLPGHPIGADGRPGQCPQSIGILQVRYPSHPSAFENNNAIRSTAYNADYAFMIWRTCFEGGYPWLNNVERGRQYAAGDGLGCMGVWFAGRWYTQPAVDYMNRLSTAGSGIPTPPPRGLKPSAPTGFTASVAPAGGVGSGQVLLAWNRPSYTAGRAVSAYTIQFSSDGGSTWGVLVHRVAWNRSYVASGLSNGRAYRFRVAAYTSAGWGPFSAVVSAVPRVAKPSAPTAFTASVAPAGGVGSGQVLLAWNLPTYVSGRAVTDYAIIRSSDGGATWRHFVDGVSRTRSFLASGLTNGHAYQFRVAAYTSAGWSPYSASVTATPNGAAGVFAAPVAVTTSTTGVTTTTTPPTTTEAATTVPAVLDFSVGDAVWVDADGDGVKDVGEPGHGGVVVRLIGAGGAVVDEDVSDPQGGYELMPTSSGSFVLEVVLPDGYEPTVVDVGLDDAIDSDVDPVDVVVGPVETTVRVAFDAVGEDDFDLDVGLVAVSEEPSPDTTVEPTTTSVPATETTTTTPISPTTTPAPTTETSPTTGVVPEPTTIPPTEAPTTATTESVTATSAPAG